ncbi:FeoA family protein [uncultured Clostridium sp.]
MLYPLSKMSIGQTAVICWLSDNKSITGRLLDLGFEPGTSVTCILRKCDGELSAFLIKGAVIALRREDADLIFIKENETETEEPHL